MVEATTFWAGVTFYVVGSLIFLYCLVFKKEKGLGLATIITATGFALHTAALIIRWVLAGHPPIVTTYETLTVVAWTAVLIFLGLQLWFEKTRILGATILPVAYLMMGLGRLPSHPIEPLGPALKSFWLYIHAFFAELSHGSFIVATAFAILFLLKNRQSKTNRVSAFYERLPSLDILDDLSYRFIALGFILLAIMIISGSIWANQAWGHYWGWDPVETWSLITWLLYGLYLHLRLFRGWAGKKAAWLAMGAFLLVVLSFWGVGFITTSVHQYLKF
jgi:cytochrome c-type biogenesis protein CcsB